MSENMKETTTTEGVKLLTPDELQEIYMRNISPIWIRLYDPAVKKMYDPFPLTALLKGDVKVEMNFENAPIMYDYGFADVRDTTGKIIFTRDILEFSQEYIEGMHIMRKRSIVGSTDGHMLFAGELPTAYLTHMLNGSNEHMTVIGNIHENPEMDPALDDAALIPMNDILDKYTEAEMNQLIAVMVNEGDLPETALVNKPSIEEISGIVQQRVEESTTEYNQSLREAISQHTNSQVVDIPCECEFASPEDVIDDPDYVTGDEFMDGNEVSPEE